MNENAAQVAADAIAEKKKKAAKRKLNQSPINITKDIVIHDKALKGKHLHVDYHKGEAEYVEVTNTGFLCVMKENAESRIAASHLKPDADYRLWQFHMHWSDDPHKGSEHCIDGNYFAAEIHCVFWNKNLGTLNDAMHHCDGYTVLALFVDESEEDNPILAPIIKAVETAIENEDKKAKIDEDFDLSKLLPEKHSYYTYDGSLTTSPFAECVTWTILHRRVKMSNQQLNVLRQIIKHNSRILQDPHDRKVHSSFHLVQKPKRLN
uniref:Alpha-carbonic anhydrase domain-containing protein n=1 Tax=Panagrolaimus sp. PS1159 TaxID=55785 RepID=A0AC35GN76_9BILA